MCNLTIYYIYINYKVTSGLIPAVPSLKSLMVSVDVKHHVHVLVPAAVPPDNYLTPLKNKRQIGPKKIRRLQDNKHCRLISKEEHLLLCCRFTRNHQGSHLPRTVIDWNNIENSTICAETF